jgi:hypothetical protein
MDDWLHRGGPIGALEGMLLTEKQHGRPHKKLDQRQLKRNIFEVIVPSSVALEKEPIDRTANSAPLAGAEPKACGHSGFL